LADFIITTFGFRLSVQTGRGRGRSQTWKAFLHNHAASIAAMDFLVVPTAGFRLLFVFVIPTEA